MICCGIPKGILVSALVAGLVAAPAAARKKERLEKEDLINVLLSPRLSQWLVGPVALIASEKEIEAYLRLSEEEAAETFVLGFWQKRVDPENPWPGQQVKDIFDRRAERADRLYTEGTNLGRRTDRGAVFILFGEPTKSGFVQDESRRDTTVEIWLYDPRARRGLHGAPPEPRYYFSRKDGVTTFASPPRILKSARKR